jgi:hypothetical protein
MSQYANEHDDDFIDRCEAVFYGLRLESKKYGGGELIKELEGMRQTMLEAGLDVKHAPNNTLRNLIARMMSDDRSKLNGALSIMDDARYRFAEPSFIGEARKKRSPEPERTRRLFSFNHDFAPEREMLGVRGGVMLYGGIVGHDSYGHPLLSNQTVIDELVRRGVQRLAYDGLIAINHAQWSSWPSPLIFEPGGLVARRICDSWRRLIGAIREAYPKARVGLCNFLWHVADVRPFAKVINESDAYFSPCQPAAGVYDLNACRSHRRMREVADVFGWPKVVPTFIPRLNHHADADDDSVCRWLDGPDLVRFVRQCLVGGDGVTAPLAEMDVAAWGNDAYAIRTLSEQLTADDSPLDAQRRKVLIEEGIDPATASDDERQEFIDARWGAWYCDWHASLDDVEA